MENPELELWNAIDELGPVVRGPKGLLSLDTRTGTARVNTAIRALIAAVQRGEWPPEAQRDVNSDVARMRAIYDRSGTP